jgi:endoglucanase
MRTIASFILALIVLSTTSVLAQKQSICLNSLGFLPQSSKKASIVGEAKSFVIKQADNQAVVFQGKVTAPVFQKDVNQNVGLADFSTFSKNGKYYLETPEGEKSVVFEISSKVYNQAFYTSMRGFYLWRCGTAVEGTHNGHLYSHAPCHMEDGYEDFQGKPDQRRDGTGGWHDAGDYGKYVVNAGVTVGMMFMAWDQFQNNLKKNLA